MSLQGAMIVVAENPAAELVEALRAAGAFPLVETKWADAPTAFVAVKPAAVIIAEPGAAPSDSVARMLCLQIATARGPVVPVIARTLSGQDAAIPIALPIDAARPPDYLIMRLRNALRVRALHETVLRRIETFATRGGVLPEMPVGDALADATVLIAGRGALYPALSVAMGERVGTIGALSVESAATQMNSRDIDGIVLGDGFPQKMVEAFLAGDARFRDIPVAVIGEAPSDLAGRLTNIDAVERDPARVVSRMVPLVRMHAFESRLKRMLKALESDGLFDPQTGLMTRDCFLQELQKSIKDADNHGYALSLACFSFSGLREAAAAGAARHLTRMIRNIDFACRGDDGTILMAFTQTELRAAHVIVRRIASELMTFTQGGERPDGDADVTLTAYQGGDTLDALLHRLLGDQAVAAE